VALNGDITNSDIVKSDTQNSDISNSETVTFCADTVTKQHPNGDIAMSPEWVEWYEGKDEWITDWSSDVTVVRHFEKALEELDLENEERLLALIKVGEPIRRTENCSLHGDFVRHGIRCGRWIAWQGMESVYSSGWQYGAGCDGCEERRKDRRKDGDSEAPEKHPGLPIRGYELRSPAFCATHGAYILAIRVYERSQIWVDAGEDRFDVSGDYNSDCPGCDSDWIYESDLQDKLELSKEEWQRGRERILDAIDHARWGHE
jgi:hypothetical protein